jgi:arylsulfatase A-like enzyme
VGKVMNDVVSNVDFLPTILELAGDNDVKNKKFDGKSFKRALDGENVPGRTSTYHELGYARAVIKDGFKYYAVRYPQYAMDFTPEQRKDTLEKYTKFRESFGEKGVSTDHMAPYGHLEMVPGGGDAEHNAYTTQPNYTSPDQLYDLRNDPKESKNLAYDPNYAAKLKEMQAELQSYLNSLPGKYNISNPVKSKPIKP